MTSEPQTGLPFVRPSNVVYQSPPDPFYNQRDRVEIINAIVGSPHLLQNLEDAELTTIYNIMQRALTRQT